MHITSLTYFIYGMSVMFYFMMAWLFWRKGNDTLSRLIMWLMMLQGAECFKDLAFYEYSPNTEWEWYVITALDMVVIPIYVIALMELCKPGWFSVKKLLLHETPFVLLPLFFMITGNSLFYYSLITWGAVYGTSTLVLTFFFISQYNKCLKQRFSYEENVNLNWLRGILVSFWFILLVWTLCSISFGTLSDNLYNICALVLWMVVSYFLYKHENVIEELMDTNCECIHKAEFARDTKDYQLQPDMEEKLRKLFEEEKLYLNPKLKLSDVAAKLGTNRTYISRYFNKRNGQTFYDYVNSMRISYAEHLLLTTSHPVFVVADEAGFNSLSTFRRVFQACHNCSPAEFRSNHQPQQ